MLTIAIRWAGLAAMLLVVGCGGGDFAGGNSPPAATGGEASFAAMVAGAAGAGGSSGIGSGGAATGGTAPLCVPGKSEACSGPAGCSGHQDCKADGSGFEECTCVGAGAVGAGAGGADGSGGAIGSAGADPSVPPTFTGPDGKVWACNNYVGGSVHRCECSWYVPGDKQWMCDVPGYDCSLSKCQVFAFDCCVNPTGHDCICTGNGTEMSCSSGPINSCP